jgi:hypothetical protein
MDIFKKYILRPLILHGLYYEHISIVNYNSSTINKLGASLPDDARVVIYNDHMFMVQATGGRNWQLIYPDETLLAP